MTEQDLLEFFQWLQTNTDIFDLTMVEILLEADAIAHPICRATHKKDILKIPEDQIKELVTSFLFGRDEKTCGYCAHRAHPLDVCEENLGEFGECSCADSGFLNGRASDSSDFPDHETVTRIGTSGQMEATDGCFVDTLDEYCEHGSPSWSRQLGLN